MNQHDSGSAFLDEALRAFRGYKKRTEAAFAQLHSEDWFRLIDPEANSLATIVKHMAGNMRSRWTDFLTSDGEKPDRDRDREFETSSPDTRASLMAQWEDGWKRLLDTVGTLSPTDLSKTVHVRGEAHSVLEAINRQTSHYAAHVGQIVLLAKHYAGSKWETLSIPRGKSKEFDVAKSGAPYVVKETK